MLMLSDYLFLLFTLPYVEKYTIDSSHFIILNVIWIMWLNYMIFFLNSRAFDGFKTISDVMFWDYILT